MMSLVNAITGSDPFQNISRTNDGDRDAPGAHRSRIESTPSDRPYARGEQISDANINNYLAQPTWPIQKSPPETCLKKKAMSTSTSPSMKKDDVIPQGEDKKSLRRVKSVDFDETFRLISAVPSVDTGTKKPFKPSAHQVDPKHELSHMNQRNIRKVRPCPNLISTAKGSPAEPAITHTGVHVIAIAPTKSAIEEAIDDCTNPTALTVQIVESETGCYEVIWDNLPSESYDSPQMRASSPDLCSQSALRGLQQVNSRLNEWSDQRDEVPAPAVLNPTVIVHTDQDSHSPRSTRVANECEDLTIPVPPNSQQTSAAASRLPSRPASAPMTRAASQDDLVVDKIPQKQIHDGGLPREMLADHALVVPDPEGQAVYQPGKNRRVRQVAAVRKLSNIEEDELRFRGHRDSVTLARARLVQPDGISTALFARRDSVLMARKRMHGRNHVTSTSREIPATNRSRTPGHSISDHDDALSTVSLPSIKEQAAQALKNNRSASILSLH